MLKFRSAPILTVLLALFLEGCHPLHSGLSVPRMLCVLGEASFTYGNPQYPTALPHTQSLDGFSLLRRNNFRYPLKDFSEGECTYTPQRNAVNSPFKWGRLAAILSPSYEAVNASAADASPGEGMGGDSFQKNEAGVSRRGSCTPTQATHTRTDDRWLDQSERAGKLKSRREGHASFDGFMPHASESMYINSEDDGSSYMPYSSYSSSRSGNAHTSLKARSMVEGINTYTSVDANGRDGVHTALIDVLYHNKPKILENLALLSDALFGSRKDEEGKKSSVSSIGGRSHLVNWEGDNGGELHDRYNPSILQHQIVNELQKHRSIVKSVLVDVSYQLYIYFRNLLRGYILGASLLLPLPTGIDRLNRVDLDDPYLLNFHNLPAKADPSDFGLEYDEVAIASSSQPELVLRAWLIPSADPHAKKAVVCTHGWFSNRQGCLPFLRVAQKIGLLRDHHILLMDSRNTGTSSSTSTDLGYGATSDLFDAIAYLSRRLGVSTLSLYSQSISSMAALLLTKNFNKRLLEELNVSLDKLVLDSPIANVLDAVHTQTTGKKRDREAKSFPTRAADLKPPTYSFPALSNVLVWMINQRWGGQLDKLRFSEFFPFISSSKLLILQSLQDNIANRLVLEAELAKLPLDRRPRNVYYFNRGSHGNLERDNQEDYEKLITDHFKGSFFRNIFLMKRLSKQTSKLNTHNL